MSDPSDAPRACQAPTRSGNPCIQRALAGKEACALHCGDDEIKRARMSELGKASHVARREKKDDDLGEMLAACAFDSLESIEAYLTAMARLALTKNDPRFLTGAARVVETSRWYLEAKGWRDECRAWRKKFKVSKSPIEGDDA